MILFSLLIYVHINCVFCLVLVYACKVFLRVASCLWLHIVFLFSLLCFFCKSGLLYVVCCVLVNCMCVLRPYALCCSI